MATLTATAAEARSNFSSIAASVFETGQAVTVFRNSKPWVVISPVNEESSDYIEYARSAIAEGRAAIEEGHGINGIEKLQAAVSKKRTSTKRATK